MTYRSPVWNVKCYTSSFIQQLLMSPYCGSGPFLGMADGVEKKHIKSHCLVELTSWGGTLKCFDCQIRLSQETSQASWICHQPQPLAWDDHSITCKVRAWLGWHLERPERQKMCSTAHPRCTDTLSTPWPTKIVGSIATPPRYSSLWPVSDTML